MNLKETTVSNIKIACFILSILGISLFIHKKKEKHTFNDKLEKYYALSENAREIYTGKIREVYNPLDQSFIVTDWLKENSKNKVDAKSFGSWPVLSIWIDPKDLYGENRGIISNENSYKRGRLWERAAKLRYFSSGELQFESLVGLRQHGRSSRDPDHKIKNFRVYLRKKYGKAEFIDLGISLKEGHRPKVITVRKELGMNFTNDVSAFLVNELGGIAPKFSHVALFINGEFYSFHHISEHLSDKSIASLLGHDNFAYVKMYSDKSVKDKVLYDELRTRLESRSFDFDSLSKYVDLDSHMSSLLVAMFTGNGDWMQGIYIKDLNLQMWKHISWDFDVAFKASFHNTKGGVANNWDIQGLYLGLDHKKAKRPWYKKVRYLIFSNLIFEDDKFRAYFSNLVDKLFVDVLNSNKLKEKFKLYEQLAKDSGNQAILNRYNDLRNFFKYRKAVFCKDLLNRVKLIPNSCK